MTRLPLRLTRQIGTPIRGGDRFFLSSEEAARAVFSMAPGGAHVFIRDRRIAAIHTRFGAHGSSYLLFTHWACRFTHLSGMTDIVCFRVHIDRADRLEMISHDAYPNFSSHWFRHDDLDDWKMWSRGDRA